MNFVKDLEECLRDLAAASRSRHPGVKEASERAVMKLRSLQAGYVAQVRQTAASPSKDHPTTAVFRSSDLLHPFLLAANYPNADYKLLEISFRAMRLLMEADAVIPADGLHMVRVYQIQAQVVTAYYQKQYAKEIQKQQQKQLLIREEEEQDNENAEENSTGGNSAGAGSANGAAASTSNTNTTTTSSWFSWGSSTSTSKTDSDNANMGSKMKNVVSSSTGQTGQAAFSAVHMEKLALEILSSLLQLMELLRNHPESLSLDVWTNALSLACLWFFLPARHTVRQAAHSTVSQIVSLLFATTSGDASSKLRQSTWEDLLTLTESERRRANSTLPLLGGAFKLCKRKNPNDQHKTSSSSGSTTAVPPSPEFALELMTQIWKEKCSGSNQFDPSDHLILKSMGVTMNLLKQQQQQPLATTHAATTTRSSSSPPPQPPVEKSLRVVQWTLTLFQSNAATYRTECRELFGQLIQPITAATDACRKHHDFEDGYTFDAPTTEHLTGGEHIDEHGFSSANVGSGSSKDPQRSRLRRPNVAPSSSVVFPVATLWKAGFVLEAVYHIFDKDSDELAVLLEDHKIVQCLAEALSDFATIGTSCRDHILQVVEFCQTQNPSSIKPTVFRKAEQLLASGTGFADDDGGGGSSTKNLEQKQLRLSNQIVGEAIWLSLQGMLRIGECTKCADTESERKSLFREVFSPSLAVLQHFLKRFSGSEELVRLSLMGYSVLADTCLPMEDCSVERRVLLTSLSKLSLPSWGKHDSTCQLQDHHIRILLCLLRIVHRHHDAIEAEWEIILWTLEELSVLDIASPLLSDEAYHASLAVSAAYERFAGFSTCFSDESLTQMTEALTDICVSTMAKRDVVGDADTVLPERATMSTGMERSTSDEHAETISGKIMSIGVRALGYGTSDSNDSDFESDLPRFERTKKAYYQDYMQSFVNRIASSSNSARMNSVGRLPFALMLLSDVAMSNAFRSKECGDTIASQFSRLAATSPVTRPFVMDMMTMLLLSRLSSGKNMVLAFEGRGRIVFDDPMHSQLLAVEPAETADSPTTNRDFSQAEVLGPLCETILNAEKADVAKSSLEVLTTIIEGTGQILHGEVWSDMIDAIASLSGNSAYRIDRTSSEWSTCCLMAFRALKFIVDDFLDALPSSTSSDETTHVSLLDCCSSFVGSRHDINTSLTAIGLLWTIADHNSDSASTDRALSELALLSSDDRPEVRNAAVNTLFSCIAGRGSGFSPAYWESCITNTVFGVYDIVTAKAGARAAATEEDTTSGEKTNSRYKVSLHHSRDSAGKMWVATQVLFLRGLIRVLRNFFTPLLDTLDDSSWFQNAWERILGFAFDAASEGSGRENIDIRSVGVELLVVSCQLTSKAGIHAAVTPARVNTNMEVVNGALRSVRGQPSSKTQIARSHSEVTDLARQKLFSEAFESLEAFDSEVLRKRQAQDDSDLQILNKFCSNLGKLFDCCRNEEFKVDNAMRSLEALGGGPDGSPHDTNIHDLESRFVRIVVSVLESSGGDPKARFLNQGQRGSLDLLRLMAGYGSSASFEKLVEIAESSFFVHKDSDSIELSDHGETDGTGTKHTATLLNFEAAAAVSQEISNDNVSDALRSYVLFLVLADGHSDNNDPKLRRCYKRIVPIVQSGLQSAARLAARHDDEASCKAVEIVWNRVLECLSYMLTPIPLGKGTFKISRVTEILSIVSSAGANVPDRFAQELCRILTFGAQKAFDAAKQHAINAEAHLESELGRKSKRHRDDLLKLFFCCFSGSCALEPEEASLRSTAETVFEGALSTSDDATKRLCGEAGLLVCQAVQENKRTEALVISIFPALCQCVVSNHGTLKEAAGTILTSFNIGETMQTAQTRCQEAEKRAVEAEQRVAELERELKRAKELKKQESSGSRLWGLG